MGRARPAAHRAAAAAALLLGLSACAAAARQARPSTGPSSSSSVTPVRPHASAPASTPAHRPASCADRTLAGLTLDAAGGPAADGRRPGERPGGRRGGAVRRPGRRAVPPRPQLGRRRGGRRRGRAAPGGRDGPAADRRRPGGRVGADADRARGSTGSRPRWTRAGRTPAALRSATAGWAGQLHAAGITMDLGARRRHRAGRHARPPTRRSARSTASSAATRPPSRRGDDGGAGRCRTPASSATAKHFPGLGRVTVNTDTDLGAADPETDPDRPVPGAVRRRRRRRGRRGHGQLGDLPAAGPRLPCAVLPRRAGPAPRPARLRRRGDQRRRGGRGGAVGRRRSAQRAVDSVAAGVDVVLDRRPDDAVPMAQALAERAAADPAFADRVSESAGRVLALKERFGLLTC